MGKEYEYYGEISAGDNETVTLTVELPDKGTSLCSTWIATPHGKEKIKDEGSCNIGKGAELKMKPLGIVSNPLNIEIKIDAIRVNILANGQLIAEHSNTKKESKTPQVYVYLTIK
jgi:hypothetical protein